MENDGKFPEKCFLQARKHRQRPGWKGWSTQFTLITSLKSAYRIQHEWRFGWSWSGNSFQSKLIQWS